MARHPDSPLPVALTVPTLPQPFPDLDEEAARRIAWEAATLDERLAATAHARRAARRRDDDTLVAFWARLFSGGDQAAFARRLQWDGWTADALDAALAADPPDEWSPRWTDALARLLGRCRDAAGRYRSEAWELAVRGLGGERDLAFADVWLPFVEAFRDDADSPGDELAPLGPDAWQAFEHQLAADLGAAGSLVLFEAFRARPDYDGFVRRMLSGDIRDIFQGYPALARTLAWIVESRAAAVRELRARLRADAAALEHAFGRPVGLVRRAAAGVSDPHDGGRRVVILEFDSAWRLAYKPRDVGIEEAFSRFLGWCRSRGADLPTPLAILARPGYGWMEVAEQEDLPDEESVRRYFRLAGGLVCAAHVLRAHDLHGENLVANRSGPALVDAEALLQPVRPAEAGEVHDTEPFDGSERDDPSRSCLYTGLVSLRHPDAMGTYYDVGGLRPARSRLADAGRPAWRGLRTDGLGYEMERRAMPPQSNSVMRDGQLVPPAGYRAAIVEGFRAAYRFFESNRADITASGGPLDAFQGHPVRVLFRSSDRYAALLRLLSAPKYWRSGVQRSMAFDALNRVFARERARPLLWPFTSDERRSLERADIPRFTVAADAREPVSKSGERIAGYLRASGVEAAARRFAGLCDEDRVRQEAWLEGALEEEEASTALPRPDRASGVRGGPPAGDAFVAAAEVLGRGLLQRARRGPNGSLAWPVMGRRVDLYGGQAGVALFLAALARTRGAEWRDAAFAALAPLAIDPGEAGAYSRRFRGIGAASGLGSLVYTLAAAGSLLEEPRLIACAVGLADHVLDEHAAGEWHFDVLDGTAGALLALLALYQASGSRTAFDRAETCAERLVARQLTTGDAAGAWLSEDGCLRAGFAHGAAGAACALARFAALADSETARSAAVAALAWERSIFSAADRNWPAIRSDGGAVVMTAWCYGAAGVAIARATMDGFEDRAEAAADLQQAIDTTIAAGPATLDHLCCGTLARAEALLTAGLSAGRDEWTARARALARPLAERLAIEGVAGARTAAFGYGLLQPGFFQGVSGIGYELLRLWQPALLASVAAFQLPSGRA